MEQYIPKSALVTEIERRIKNLYPKGGQGMVVTKILKDHYEDLLSFIDTLEVREVDLEEEIQRQYDVHKNTDNSIVKDCVIMTKDGFEYFAKHFFELGLCSTITKEDCKLIWNIGDDLPYMPEEDFFGELLRRYKAQKGE